VDVERILGVCGFFLTITMYLNVTPFKVMKQTLDLVLRLTDLLNREYIRAGEPDTDDSRKKKIESIMEFIQPFHFPGDHNNDMLRIKTADAKFNLCVLFDAGGDFCICEFGRVDGVPVYSGRVTSFGDLKIIIRAFSNMLFNFTWKKKTPGEKSPEVIAFSRDLALILSANAGKHVKITICTGVFIILNIDGSSNITEFFVCVGPLGMFRMSNADQTTSDAGDTDAESSDSDETNIHPSAAKHFIDELIKFKNETSWARTGATHSTEETQKLLDTRMAEVAMLFDKRQIQFTTHDNRISTKFDDDDILDIYVNFDAPQDFYSLCVFSMSGCANTLEVKTTNREKTKKLIESLKRFQRAEWTRYNKPVDFSAFAEDEQDDDQETRDSYRDENGVNWPDVKMKNVTAWMQDNQIVYEEGTGKISVRCNQYCNLYIWIPSRTVYPFCKFIFTIDGLDVSQTDVFDFFTLKDIVLALREFISLPWSPHVPKKYGFDLSDATIRHTINRF
jgi:hypothetical protein